jgi:hypothetical protein
MLSLARLRTSGNSFWERVAGDVGGRPAQDFALPLQLFGPHAQLTILGLQIATRR